MFFRQAGGKARQTSSVRQLPEPSTATEADTDATATTAFTAASAILRSRHHSDFHGVFAIHSFWFSALATPRTALIPEVDRYLDDVSQLQSDMEFLGMM